MPYPVLGLFAGVFVDRWPRRTVLVWAGIGRAVSLALIPVLWWLGVLQVWVLVCLLLVFGAFAVFGFAATQSFLPRVVPRDGLVRANARLDQADNTAQTLGPTIGGGLVGVLGAPVALLVDSVSYLAEAALNASLRVDEPRRPRRVMLACAPSWARAGGPPTGTPRWGPWRSRRTSGWWPTGWG